MLNNRGFTLVELSIVLVIIGLLVGGILAAQSMIQTAKILRLVSDLQQYEIAANNFKTSFKYYPGDDDLFTPPGNKDDQMGYGAAGMSVACNGAYANTERDQLFSHLSQANMLSKNYAVYSPVSCGGPHNNSQKKVTPGLVFPYVELDSKAAKLLGAKYYFISDDKLAVGNTNLYFNDVVSASDVLPLESKLPYNGISGLDNYFGKGNCGDSNSFPVSCGSDTAVWGLVYYYVQPVD